MLSLVKGLKVLVVTKNPTKEQVAEGQIMEKVKLPCTMGDTCEYVTPELENEHAMQMHCIAFI